MNTQTRTRTVLTLAVVAIVSLALAATSTNALAEDVDWNNDDADRRWDNPDNWLGKDTATAHVPTSADKAAIRNVGDGPIIDSITTAVTNHLVVGDWGNTNTLDITGGSLTTNNWFIIGYGGSDVGTFNVSGGTTTVFGGDIDLTVGRAGTGHMNVIGGSVVVGDKLYVGRKAGGTGEIIMDAGLIDIVDDLYLGDEAADSTGNLTMRGGTIKVAQDLTSGRDGASTITMIDGLIDVGEDLEFGNDPTAIGGMTMTGGEITVTNNMKIGDDGASEVTMSDGLIEVGNILYLGQDGTGSLTMTGGSIAVVGVMTIGRNPGSSGELFLDGGTISCSSLEMEHNGGDSAAMDINGGTLILNGDAESLIDGFFSAGKITALGGGGILNYDLVTNPGMTTVTAVVPEPSTVTMLLLALGAIGILRRRRA